MLMGLGLGREYSSFLFIDLEGLKMIVVSLRALLIKGMAFTIVS